MKVNIFIKSLLVAVFVLSQLEGSAQTMTVGTNTYVYATNEVVCVTGGLKLVGNTDNLNGNLYLRNGAQLVQKDIDPSISNLSTNSGSGVLSVYQEGTVDNYSYNYWCSPVGDTITNMTGNNPFRVTRMGRPKTITTAKFATTIHNSKYDGTSNPLNIEPYFVNKFVSKNTYSGWENVGEGDLDPGYGFSMKGSLTSDTGIPANNPDGKQQRYDFRGRPNSGDITMSVSVIWGTDPDPGVHTDDKGNFTLIGNPYPSVIDLDEFFKEPQNFNSTDLIAYFWEQGPTVSHTAASFTGGYGVYCPYSFNDPDPDKPFYIPAVFFNYDGNGNPITCLSCTPLGYEGNIDREFVPIGQGFMVKADPSTFVSSKPYVIMKNSYRTFVKEGPGPGDGTGSVFSRMKGQSEVPHIRFATTLDNGPISQIVQAFIPESTDGIDKGKDVVNPNNNPTMVNFLVKGKRCVLSSIPFDISRKIPLIFDNKKEANYKITVKEMINLDQVSNVYLHDKVADAYYDIKNSFYELILPAGMNYTQYEITFQKESALGVGDFTENSFMIYQDNSAKKMFLKNPNLKDIISFDLYDIAGKLIFSKKQLGIQDSYEFSTAELRDGIYIVKATSSENKIKGQKIIVKY